MSRRIVAAAAVFSLSVLAGATAYAKKTVQVFEKQIPKPDRVDQALNRLTFGPRPGDAERVKAMGLKKWIDLQLHPGRIAENPVLTEKLKALDSLFMSSQELVVNFPEPRTLRDNLKGGLPVPVDPDRTRILQKMAERFELRQKQKLGDQVTPEGEEKETASLLTAEQLRSLRTGTPQQRLAAFQAFPKEMQDDLLVALPQRLVQPLSAVAPPELRRKIQLTAGPPQMVARDLAEGKLLRAIYSNRQLEEVLTDFWYNHFNVYIDKGADRFLVTAYERDVIRPHVLGKFRDLLEATAKSPAMLFYLDNWESVGSNPRPGRAGATPRRGLNENYGRELLELHTLGVDGGYSQKDVTEVARCFTGWSITRPQLGGGFNFNARTHDEGEKVVLGQKIHAGGIEDGEKVLDLLAHHPATARFISRKLAMRFVADDPPASLVDRMAQTFLKTDGDLRAVMKAMLESKEFWSVGAYRSKLKSPLEMVASAVRAGNGDVDYARSLADQVAQMGEPLYRKLEPTGYSNSGKEWLNSAGLVARMNFALNLADNKVPGVKVEATAAGVTLGSPEFQKH
jgi:uncharacterized protein (DUF1800 family)